MSFVLLLLQVILQKEKGKKKKDQQCYKLKSDILNHYRDQKLSAKAEASILDAIKYKKQFQLNTLRVLQGSSSKKKF